MSLTFVLKMLEDRIVNVETKLDEFSTKIHDKIDKNFKFQNILIFFGSLPTLQALGVPTKELGAELIKKAVEILGFIRGIR